MIKELLYVIILLLGIPVGYLIAWMSRDELIIGRNWFKALIGICLILGGYFFLVGNFVYALTLGFIIIVSLISLKKSFDKKWTEN